jgi:hypothetical protein
MHCYGNLLLWEIKNDKSCLGNVFWRAAIYQDQRLIDINKNKGV